MVPQYTQLFIGALQYALLPLATMYGGYVFIKTPAQIPPEPYEQEVELSVMRRTILVAEYMLIHNTRTFFNSNLVRYLIQASGGSYATIVRLFNQWVEYLLVKEVDAVGAQEPLFPNPQQIPNAEIQPLDAAQLMLDAELRRGGDQPPRADVVNALQTFLAEVDRVYNRMEQAVQGRQVQDVAVQTQQEQAVAQTKEGVQTEYKEPRGGILLNPNSVHKLIRSLYDSSLVQNGEMTDEGILQALKIIERIMTIRTPNLTASFDDRTLLGSASAASLNSISDVNRIVDVLRDYYNARSRVFKVADEDVTTQSVTFAFFIAYVTNQLAKRGRNLYNNNINP